MPKYAAVDLSKLPIIRYDATDISGLLLSHNKLEETVVELTERIKHSTNIIENLATNQTVLSKAFKEFRDSNTDMYMNNSQNKQMLPNTKNDNITAQENIEENFECPDCDHKCKNEIEKSTHMLSHTEELNCPGGDLLPSKDCEIKEHITSHEVGCKSSECDIRHNDQNDLAEHTTIHSKSFNCHKCKGNFETEIEFGEHMLTHVTTSKLTPESTDINESLRPITSEKPFSCTSCDLKYNTKSELDSHMREHSSKSAIKCKYCTFSTLNEMEFVKHYATHISDKTHQCWIQQMDTTNESLSSLGGINPQDKIQIETHKKEMTPVGAGAIDRTYLCPKCDFRCSSNAAMKLHMQAHNPEIYMICDEDLCKFECVSKDELQAHKTGHLPRNDNNYADTLKQDLYSNDQNRHEWSQPFLNGKPMRNKSYKQSSFDQHRSATNNTHGYQNNYRDNQRGPHHLSRTKPNTIKGSNSNSSLAVAPRPHLAKVFASGFTPGTNPDNIKKDLEENIQKITGKQYAVQIETLNTRFDTYSSFKISCYCIDSNIFMNSQIWPANVLIKWFKERRTHVNGPESRFY